MFQIGTIIPTVLTNAFHLTNFFPCFCQYFVPISNINVAPFSAHKNHTTCSSSYIFMVSLLVQFLSTHCVDKKLLVPCSLFYSSQLMNRSCMDSLTMKHLYFLHVQTIYDHFWNSVIPKYKIKLRNALALKLFLL